MYEKPVIWRSGQLTAEWGNKSGAPPEIWQKITAPPDVWDSSLSLPADWRNARSGDMIGQWHAGMTLPDGWGSASTAAVRNNAAPARTGINGVGAMLSGIGGRASGAISAGSAKAAERARSGAENAKSRLSDIGGRASGAISAGSAKAAERARSGAENAKSRLSDIGGRAADFANSKKPTFGRERPNSEIQPTEPTAPTPEYTTDYDQPEAYSTEYDQYPEGDQYTAGEYVQDYPDEQYQPAPPRPAWVTQSAEPQYDPAPQPMYQSAPMVQKQGGTTKILIAVIAVLAVGMSFMGGTIFVLSRNNKEKPSDGGVITAESTTAPPETPSSSDAPSPAETKPAETTPTAPP